MSPAGPPLYRWLSDKIPRCTSHDEKKLDTQQLKAALHNRVAIREYGHWQCPNCRRQVSHLEMDTLTRNRQPAHLDTLPDTDQAARLFPLLQVRNSPLLNPMMADSCPRPHRGPCTTPRLSWWGLWAGAEVFRYGEQPSCRAERRQFRAGFAGGSRLATGRGQVHLRLKRAGKVLTRPTQERPWRVRL